jgi:hypothetical protein
MSGRGVALEPEDVVHLDRAGEPLEREGAEGQNAVNPRRSQKTTVTSLRCIARNRWSPFVTSRSTIWAGRW